jgi:hypothetical protein
VKNEWWLAGYIFRCNGRAVIHIGVTVEHVDSGVGERRWVRRASAVYDDFDDPAATAKKNVTVTVTSCSMIIYL